MRSAACSKAERPAPGMEVSGNFMAHAFVVAGFAASFME
jgi:hypothetical protein